MINKLFWMLAMAVALVGFSACGSDDKKGDEPEPTPDVKPVETTYNAPVEGGTLSVEFTAPTSWEATVSDKWVTVSPVKGAEGKQTIKVTVNENTTYEEREASVIVRSSQNFKILCNVTVKQAPAQKPEKEHIDPLNPEEEEHEMVGNMGSDAMTIVGNISVGWNLGNTCESDGNETAWGNPKTTQQMISFVKQCGFNAVRVPVRWYKHADEDFVIDEAWLARIAEIVQYCINEDMYVIVNSHHDNWYDRLPVGYDQVEIKEKFAKMWTQIARYFRDYDEHLIFAGVNEMVKLNADGSENWNYPTSSNQNLLNDLQTIFVTRVRATGGNNAVRCLMIQAWACNTDHVFLDNSTFMMPKDRVEGRLIYDFHQYAWTYSTEAAGNDNKFFWGEPFKDFTPWFQNGEAELDWRYGELQKKFIDNGIPVVMSEFGCVQHNKSGNNQKADESRAYYHKEVVARAKQHGIKCFYWDNGQFTSNGENFGLIDRKNLNVPTRAQIALDGIMEGANN